MKNLLIVCCLCLFTISASAQEESRLKLFSLETGADIIITEVIQYDNIRAEAGWSGEAEKNIQGSAGKFYGGLKLEVRSRNNTFGFSGGLRYTRLVSALGKGNGYYSVFDTDYFYFRVAQSANTIEYVKIKEITEASDYIGIPLAVTWTPFGQHLFTPYFKAGIEVNFRMGIKTTVEFVDPEMKQYYTRDVLDQLRTAGKVNAVFNTAGGCRVRINSNVALSVELGPSAFLTQNNSSLVDTLGSFGGQINLQFGL